MVYRALGALSSARSLSISFAEFHENAGKWFFELKTNNNSYPEGDLNILIRQFIEKNNLQYQVALITVHNEPGSRTFNGATIAATTALPVITDLSALDLALGGNGEFYSTASNKLNLASEKIDELNKTICVAFMGILRWREEYNFLSSITGASRSSIGGAIWLGQEG